MERNLSYEFPTMLNIRILHSTWLPMEQCNSNTSWIFYTQRILRMQNKGTNNGDED